MKAARKPHPAAMPCAAGLALAAAAALLLAAPHAAAQPTSADQPRAADAQPAGTPPAAKDSVQRGRYLVAAGDCVACHTQPGAAPFTGGRPVETPFGTVLSANLTPDEQTGIGRYDAASFYRALHEGVDRDGHNLYPAFPYPYYTRVTREDSDAMFAYLRTLAPANHPLDRNKLHFPFNIRPLMAVWNMMFLDKGTQRADASKPAEWNRGAYLVEGLGHCGACHTPRNKLGGPKEKLALQGGRFSTWFAPDITPNQRTGIGGWKPEELARFLRDGRNVHTLATGEMGEMVAYSTSQMTPGDVRAIAAYLRSLPASPQAEARAAPSAALMKQGEAVWRDACAACHREDAAGVAATLPPLRSSANLQQNDATTVLHYILAGSRHRPTDGAPTPLSMPAFDWKLDDAEIAAVATYARNSWGNQAPLVEADEVAKLRKELAKAPARQASAWSPPAAPSEDMHRPGSATRSQAGTDSRDNGTPNAGRDAPP